MDIESVECLLCHAVHGESFAGDRSRSWRCTHCGQRWDAARVAAVMNYEQWLKAAATTIEHGAVA